MASAHTYVCMYECCLLQGEVAAAAAASVADVAAAAGLLPLAVFTLPIANLHIFGIRNAHNNNNSNTSINQSRVYMPYRPPTSPTGNSSRTQFPSIRFVFVYAAHN